MDYKMTEGETHRWNSADDLERYSARKEVRSAAWELVTRYNEPVEVFAHNGTLVDFLEPPHVVTAKTQFSI